MIEELYKECLIFNYQAKNISSEKIPAQNAEMPISL